PFAGVPFLLKELASSWTGAPNTNACSFLRDVVADLDTEVVRRMKAAGLVLVGKSNAPENGWSISTEPKLYGATKNPWKEGITPGGSSGGAAVALALDMLPLADGSDFGGSLRNPAAYNNVYGFRPSQGLVPAGPDLDVFHAQMGVEGPMGRNVRDMALLLDEQAGYDPRAPLSHHKHGSFLEGLRTPATGGRIAWFGDLGGHLPVEPGILQLCEAALGRFADVSFQTEALVPDFDFEALWQAFVTLRQASSGCALKAHYDDPFNRSLLKPEAVWEVEHALQLAAPQIHAATVRRSSWHKTLLSLFDRFDLVALPTAQIFPFEVSTHWPTQVAGRAMDSYHRWMQVSAFATLGGCPAVNVPAGFDARGRPMGMQLIGRPRGDMAVLRAAAAYETTLPWQAGAT
ncbi:MAG: amidase, partial [Mesorhizobium sp.]